MAIDLKTALEYAKGHPKEKKLVMRIFAMQDMIATAFDEGDSAGYENLMLKYTKAVGDLVDAHAERYK